MRPRGTAGAASRVVAMCGVGAQTAGGVCRPAATVVPVRRGRSGRASGRWRTWLKKPEGRTTTPYPQDGTTRNFTRPFNARPRGAPKGGAYRDGVVGMMRSGLSRITVFLRSATASDQLQISEQIGSHARPRRSLFCFLGLVRARM